MATGRAAALGFWNAVRWRQLLPCLLVLVAGCGGAGPVAAPVTGKESSAKVLDVVATVGMVADAVRVVGGERVRVTQLMGPGVDPHLYKPTRDDVRRISQADLVVSSGLLLEGRMEETLTELARTRPVCVFTSAIPEEHLLTPEGSGGHPDPHVWMDVSAWAGCVDTLVNALSQLDAAHASEFRERSSEWQQQLRELHEYGLKSVGSIPRDHRVLVTSHDAFNYFGRAYDLEVLGVQGLSTESEAGLQRINELVDLLVDRRVQAVFVESSVPPKNIQALMDGARARGHEVRIGGELFSDAMGAEGTWEGTYIGMLDHNITMVTRALGGDAPERGLQGRLSIAGESP